MQFSQHDKITEYSCQPKLGWTGTELRPAVNHHSSLPMGGYRASYVYHQRHRHNTGGSHDLCGRQRYQIIILSTGDGLALVPEYQVSSFIAERVVIRCCFIFSPNHPLLVVIKVCQFLLLRSKKELQIHINEFYRILMAFLLINVDIGLIFCQC